MTAGSNPILSATNGSTHPINLANNTTTTRVAQITSATAISNLSTNISFMKLAEASVIPQRAATLISFHMTLNISLNSISPSESPRITETLD